MNCQLRLVHLYFPGSFQILHYTFILSRSKRQKKTPEKSLCKTELSPPKARGGEFCLLLKCKWPSLHVTWEFRSDPIILRYLLPDRAVYNQRQCCHVPIHPQTCFLWNFAYEEGKRSIGKKEENILVSPKPHLFNLRPNQCSSQASCSAAPCHTTGPAPPQLTSAAAPQAAAAAQAAVSQTLPASKDYHAHISFRDSCSHAHPGPPAAS